MSAKKEVVRGSILLTIFSILASGVAYLTKLILVRNLTVEEYGLFFSVLTFILFLQVFVSLGLTKGLARSIAKYRVRNENEKIKSVILGSFVIQMVSTLILMAALFFTSSYLATNYFENESAKNLLLALLLFLPLSVLRSQFASIFNGFSKNKYLSSMQLVYNTGILLITIILFQKFQGITVPLIAYLGAFVVLTGVFIIPLFKTINLFKIKSSKIIEPNKELLLFSYPLLFSTIGVVFITYFDTLMLTHFSSLADVGIYNIVNPTAMLLVLIGKSIGIALLPAITSLWEKKKKNGITTAYAKICSHILIITIPGIIVLTTLSKHIIEVFFGPEYLSGKIAFIILVIGSLFQIFILVNNSILTGIGKSPQIAYIYSIGSILNVILNLILIPLFSLTGAAIATLSSFVIMFLVSFKLLRKEIQIIFPFKKIVLITLFSSSIFISICAFWATPYNIYFLTFVGLLTGAGIYVFLILFFKVIDLKELFEMLGIDLKREVLKIKKKIISKKLC